MNTIKKLKSKLGIDRRYCSRCGTKLRYEGYHRTICDNCNDEIYWEYGSPAKYGDR